MALIRLKTNPALQVILASVFIGLACQILQIRSPVTKESNANMKMGTAQQ